MSEIESRLEKLGIILPNLSKPSANYIPIQQVGSLIYTSGQTCKVDGQLILKGKLGKDLTLEEGKIAARQTALNCLSIIKNHIKDLDKVVKIVKVLSFVNSAPGFVKQPYVVNSISSLLEDIFEEKGKHARSAIGVNELPFDAPVETEMIVEIKK